MKHLITIKFIFRFFTDLCGLKLTKFIMAAAHCGRSKHMKWIGAKNSKIKFSKQGLMPSFPSQNDKKKGFSQPTGCTQKNRPG